MSTAFDTLTFSERLQKAGASKALADEHAKLARDLIMADLVTRDDLRSELEIALSRQSLQMTMRFGGMLAASVGILIAAMSFFIS